MSTAGGAGSYRALHTAHHTERYFRLKAGLPKNGSLIFAAKIIRGD